VESLRQLYDLFLKTGQRIVTDTRKIQSDGGVFFALKGDNFNGNRFAKQAIDDGCQYAIIDDEEFKVNDQLLLVEDTLQTLQDLASYHRQQFSIPILAITGSNGKTTTKELVKACMSTKYKTLATIGNLNNHIGVPLTLLNLSDSHEFAIVELGTNNPGEIASLAHMTAPTHALVTSIGKAHLEGLGSIDGVAKEKLSLFDVTRESGGTVFANMSSNYIREYVGTHPELEVIRYDEKGGGSFQIDVQSYFPTLVGTITDGITLNSSLFGEHNLLNMAAALTVAESFDVEFDKSVTAINQLSLNNNRTQTINKENTTIYLDAYNANPTSVKAAIKAFAHSKHQHKWLILGDMFELGEHEIQEHQTIVDVVSSFKWEQVVFVGKLFGQTNLQHGQLHVDSTDEARRWLSEQQFEKQEILIKASRSMALETLVDVIG